ncbi:MAG: DUF3800 domain-containing protein [Alphaproteobacteria bacterium]|nr:DUF3800 domain-containing protein [Alphaproteobacteria bacterium]
MLVSIDESGDTGFKEASSRYFILTMVVFPEEKGGRYPAAEQTAASIKRVMQQTRHKPEFHFTACSHGVRNSFFHALNEDGCDFDIYSLVVDKTLVTSDVLKKNSTKFYNFFLKLLLTNNPVDGATIKIDGQKSKEFRKALQSYLRQGNHGMIAKLKFCDSKEDVLIQLADMACGAIAYSYNRADKLESGIFKKLLGKRIKNIWLFK